MALNYQCIDAVSPYCPCYLAETNSCIACSILQGKETCDCRWQGFCVYQEFIWNGRRKKEPRRTLGVKIIEKKTVTNNLIVFKVLLPLAALSREYSQPGTYVFLRAVNSPSYFEFPLCVMDTNEDKNTLTFAMQIIGPKTRSLAREDRTLLLRGPYYNGIFGLKHIKSSVNKKCLLIGRGIGQASLVLVAKTLVRGGNDITAFLDPGVINCNPARELLESLGVRVQVFDFSGSPYENYLRELIENGGYEVVYSGGSETQHNLVKALVEQSGRKIALAVSNNAQMCCGEGVCGSCETLVGGKRLQLCKVQTESKNVMGVNAHA
ncbi:sulfide/dihydroorotate dehydrogenase-like FAD/NAD-binding protein [Thermosediminibacter litoriperuensis]|uniref:NAD(P)H-flavin reductase n=1 Tax=Thermosediminibacter litoriperuensis TaxID=291989 RepID=A0A5S5AZZ3_9FIRM|nr:sulfide/dihydroorotate dehydrogenase-like FAD/NAD-binding protein [Thermosediminibacter litoriperuensis]TYP59878.1 NAD(P)H-flavin reductase [Thermosediminibacter litoriperuensis]